jgi:outer membrane protein assembly factor BamD (BamD/ComL family)
MARTNHFKPTRKGPNVVGCAILALVAGCANGNLLSRAEDPDRTVAAQEESAASPVVRTFQAGQWKEQKADNVSEAGQRAYQEAEQLFQQERYADAEAAFKRIANDHKDTPLEEDAMFMIAECQFLTQQYPKAQDSYERLMQKYSNTRHLDKAARRQFAIGKTWLNGGSDEQQGVRQARFDAPLVTNITDKTRPLMDTEGRALESLQSVWLHDPTGPLADDSLMMAGGHYFVNGQYEEAEHQYDLVREQYPKSEHQSMAHLLGAKAKLRAYGGPQYDGSKLDEADRLMRSAVRQFPELSEDRPRIYRNLEAIRAQKAERLWAQAEYYRRTLHPGSARIYYQLLLERYPDTKWAEFARQRITPNSPPASESQNTEGS